MFKQQKFGINKGLTSLKELIFMSEKQTKMSRRTTALLWCFAVAVVIGVLIYLEQIAILYVLATVGLVALLLIVGFSDLEKIGREGIEGTSPRAE